MASNVFRFDESWEIPDASVADIYDVLSRGELLPRWWRGVYLEAHKLSDNKDPRVGDRLRVRARGALPYELNFVIEAVDLVPSKKVAVRTVSDFEGLWTATLSQRGKDVHVDLVWQVTVLRPILKFLAPVLRPPSPGTIAGRRCAGRRVEGVSCGEKAVTSASLPISRSVMRTPLPPLCVSQRARRCRRPPGGRR